MRFLCVALLVSCSTGPARDAGSIGLPECSPPAMGVQTCVPPSTFSSCASGEATVRQNTCFSQRPIRTSWVCNEGIQWRISGSTEEICSFVDGQFVGASLTSPTDSLITGSWQMTGCVQTDLCPERDAGTCRPAAISVECDDDRTHFSFCASTEAEERTQLCSDAGVQSYGRLFSVCDGGVQLVTVISGTGPTETCVYVDGGFAGGSNIDDTNRGAVYGSWELQGCEALAPLCP